MKKLAAIIICMILASTMLTGCGVSKILKLAGLETRETVYTEGSTEQDETDTIPSSTQDETDSAPSSEQDETETTISAGTEEISTDKIITQGSWNDNVYTNEFAEIQMTLPDDWTYSSKEQMAELMQVGSEYLTDEAKFEAELSEMSLVYCAVVYDTATGNSIAVILEKQYTNLDAEQYIDIISQKLLDSFEEIQYTIDDIGTQSICGKEYITCQATLTQNKTSQTYLARRVGDYMVDIIITNVNAEANDESAANLLNVFTAIT